MTRAEQIKELYKSKISKGQIVDKRHIIENSTGNSYDSVFGKYLKDDVTEISLDEPYIREHYQVRVILVALAFKLHNNWF